MSDAGRSVALVELERRLTDGAGPFAIDEVPVHGTPCRVWRHQRPSLIDLFENGSPDDEREYLVYEEERWTYRAHRGAVADLADLLAADLGVQPGDRVAIAMRNVPEWSISFWATVVLGAVAVPLNAWWTGDELAFAIDDSGAAAVVVDHDRLVALDRDRCRPRCPLVVARAAEEVSLQGAHRWSDHVGTGRGRGRPWGGVNVAPDEPATILYTSGTSARPKGVVGTHRNICSTIVSVDYVGAWSTGVAALSVAGASPPATATPPGPPVAGPPVTLLGVPLFHATGLHGVLVGMLARGGRVVMMHKWDAGVALDLVERESVTAFTGVPAMVRQMVDAAGPHHRLDSLAALTSGGAATPPDLIDRVRDRLPSVTMRSGYGLTESSTVVAIIGGADYAAHPDSVGVPVPVCEVRIVDAAGRRLPAGEVGEVTLRGVNIAAGYWNLPDETAVAFRDGWFHSGDLGRVDDDGYLYIVDRLKDLIIRGGENIAAPEVEAAIFRHADVLDVAVVPVPHDVLGEEVGAVVVRRPGSMLSADDVRSTVAARLAAFKVPAHVYFVDDPLPRSPQGKVLKRQLRPYEATEQDADQEAEER